MQPAVEAPEFVTGIQLNSAVDDFLCVGVELLLPKGSPEIYLEFADVVAV